MKKFLTFICMITCIFGLTACGSEKELTEFEQYKRALAEATAIQAVIPCVVEIVSDPATVADLKEYTAAEVEYAVLNAYGLNVDGNGFIGALDSFEGTLDTIGGIENAVDAETHFDKHQIIVNVQLQGTRKDAVAEIVFSNDVFLVVESASLNEVSTTADSVRKAGLNTLLGMGTVFTVLILISIIISAFGLISKVQAAMNKPKEKKEDVRAAGIDQAVAKIAEQEEGNGDYTDDCELVAVIAAAIAASEGAASTDGFVVRSIKRRKAF